MRLFTLFMRFPVSLLTKRLRAYQIILFLYNYHLKENFIWKIKYKNILLLHNTNSSNNSNKNNRKNVHPTTS